MPLPSPEVAHETTEEIRAKRLSTEEMVRLQLDRINAFRSDVTNPDRIVAWSESLEALADLLLPWWEDDEDWRAKWDARPVAVVTLEGGMAVPIPTAQDCRKGQLLLMELLHKHNLLVKTRKVSGPTSKVKPAEESPTVALEM